MTDSPPSTVNVPATIANDILHVAIFDVAVPAALTAIYADVPILNLPIVSALTADAVSYLSNQIYAALAKVATFAIIDAQTSVEAAAANAAQVGLVAALSGGDPNAIIQAQAAFAAALAKLVHLDGSAQS